jgi:phosphonate transport system substrate-binding protein
MKKFLFTGCLLLLSLSSAACSPTSDSGKSPSASSSASPTDPKTLKIGTIPDQDPKKLQQLYDKLAKYLGKELKVSVSYKPAKDAAATLAAFDGGDLDLVWFSGATGVQARAQVSGAVAIAQREKDAESHSVFIANTKSKIPPTINNQKGLTALKGHTFTFSGDSSITGRLMPQYFLEQAGVKLENFKGAVGFSKSQEATIDQVQAGTYDAGVVDQKVWEKRLQEGKTDPAKIDLIWQSPAYPDYHWVINPNVKDRFENNFIQKVQTALLKLNPYVREQKEILDLFGTEKFIRTQNTKYVPLEKISREISAGK